MRIAIVGAGVSGNVAAWLLSQRHSVDLFESQERLGGHAHTSTVRAFGREFDVDTGFMVFNDRTYPNFRAVLNRLDVVSQDSDMSFSVSCSKTGLEYQGSSFNGLFAQRSNLLSPRFFKLLAEIVRFNRIAPGFLLTGNEQTTMGDYLRDNRFGAVFVEQYLVPMGAAIWSAKPRIFLEFPATFLIRFFANHGLLQIRDRPVWQTIVGGSRNYVQKMLAAVSGQIHQGRAIVEVQRCSDRVLLTDSHGDRFEYDEVVFATHADQTLGMLIDATNDEKRVLGSFPYQKNVAVLHTDMTVLPSRTAAWASWNYRVTKQTDQAVLVTYDLNRLQSLGAPQPICVTLNPGDSVAEKEVLSRFTYSHPVFGFSSVRAQQQHSEISGRNRSHFCGAYWGNGFHEDGVNSALRVCQHFNIDLQTCSAASTKATSFISGSSR